MDLRRPIPASTGPGRVLVVEPKASHAAALARRIAGAGYRVATAEGTQRAMAELQRVSVDLIIAELRMPGAGGIELARMLREDPVHRETPLLLIAGRSDSEGAVQAYRCGADAVIAKPFDMDVLVARIGREIERAQALARLRFDNAALDARIIGRALELGDMQDRLLAAEQERRRLQSLVARSA